MYKLNAKFDADSLLYSVILNVMATQDMWSLNGIYCPTDWYNEVIIVHTCAFQSTLLGCQFVTQTVLIILTMVGYFPVKCVCVCVIVCV